MQNSVRIPKVSDLRFSGMNGSVSKQTLEILPERMPRKQLQGAACEGVSNRQHIHRAKTAVIDDRIGRLRVMRMKFVFIVLQTFEIVERIGSGLHEAEQFLQPEWPRLSRPENRVR